LAHQKRRGECGLKVALSANLADSRAELRTQQPQLPIVTVDC
jgi:hypothetical protein